MVEDLLLVRGHIQSIQEIVSSQVVVFVGTGNETSSHLKEKLSRDICSEERELLHAPFSSLVSHQYRLFELSSLKEAVVRARERSERATDTSRERRVSEGHIHEEPLLHWRWLSLLGFRSTGGSIELEFTREVDNLQTSDKRSISVIEEENP